MLEQDHICMPQILPLKQYNDRLHVVHCSLYCRCIATSIYNCIHILSQLITHVLLLWLKLVLYVRHQVESIMY